MALPPTQLLVYAFAPGARFEGHLIGALERIEAGGALRILAVLFVHRDPDGGELVAFEHRGGAAGLTLSLTDFRLRGPDERRAATHRALQGAAGRVVRELGDQLEPGGAVAAVLLAHAWADVLADAAARTGGTPVPAGAVDADRLAAELAP